MILLTILLPMPLVSLMYTFSLSKERKKPEKIKWDNNPR
jgi:hypothetical protein